MPAIIINDNPDWNGGMVVSAGLNMIIGWKGPDTRLFENVLLFMLDGKTDTADDGSLDVIDNINDLIGSAGSEADTTQESDDATTSDELGNLIRRN